MSPEDSSGKKCLGEKSLVPDCSTLAYRKSNIININISVYFQAKPKTNYISSNNLKSQIILKGVKTSVHHSDRSIILL